MTNKLDKRTNCEYCDKPLDAKYRSKRFCDDKCRIYWNREKKFEKELTDVLKENRITVSKTQNDLNTIGVAITKTENGKIERVDPLSREGQEIQSKINEPKENTMAFYLKYDCYTWGEVNSKK
jgi:hypothetical protein